MSSPVALVTGGSRGIGRGIAIELARAGFSVAINYAGRKDAAVECRQLCAEAARGSPQPSFEIIQADMAQSADRARLLGEVQERFGWMDLLVNNAGVAPTVRADLLEAGEESFDRLMNINARGPFFLTQAAAKFWIAGLPARDPASPRPKIVNITSVSAFAPGVTRGEYCMSKAAFSMTTQLFAIRLAAYGINVYEIRPGVVETDMTVPVKEKYERLISQGLAPIARWGTPQDVGRAVAAIAEGRFPYSTGEVINVDGGFHIRHF